MSELTLIDRSGKWIACIFLLALYLGCGEENAIKPETSSLTAIEQTILNRQLSAADSLTAEGNYAASDSLLALSEPYLAKTGRSKKRYLAHRKHILNLVYAEKSEQACRQVDTLIRKFAMEDDSLSGFYQGLSGWLYKEMGNCLAAIPSLERAASLFEKHGPKDKLNGIYNNLGISYGQVGDHEKAIHNYEAALQINKQKADSVEIANNCYNLALAHLNLGDLTNAQAYNQLGRAFDVEHDGSFDLQQAEINFAKGQAQMALQQVAKLKNHPELFDPETNPRAGENLFSLGQILLAAGRADEALVYLKKRLVLPAVVQTGATNWERTKNLVLLGHAFLKKDDPATALTYFQQAIQSATPSFKPSDLLQNPIPDSLPAESWAMESLCGKTEALDRLSQVNAGITKQARIQKINSALDAAECAVYVLQQLKNNFVEDDSRLWLGEYTFQNAYEKPLEMCVRLNALTGDGAALERAYFFASKAKAGVLRTALAERRQLLDAHISTDSIHLLRDLRLQIAALQNSLQINPTDEARNQLFKAKRALDQCRSSLKLPPIGHSATDNYSVRQIQQWLPDSVLWVEYVLSDEILYTFSISKNSFSLTHKALPDHFDALIDGFHRSASDWQWIADSAAVAEQTYLRTAPALFDLLLKEAISAHPKSNRLFIIPDKKLARLPFSALLTRSFSGSWKDIDLPVLIKDMAISYRFSAPITLENTPTNKPEPRYGFGGFGTDYRDDFTFSSLQKSTDPVAQNLLSGLRGGPDTLDFADDEVDSITQLTGGQKWVNRQATKSNFLKNVENCRILHLSLHTVEMDPHDPTGLAILFSKASEKDASLLTSSELYSLDLQTELVVVSSCQSGIGQFKRGEGTLSLGRALSLAGCRSTVVNLWKADDRSSQELMISFYKNLKSGQTKDRALQNALIHYLDNTISERASPQFWANFSAIGEMDDVAFDEKPLQNFKHWWALALILALLFGSAYYFNRRARQKP